MSKTIENNLVLKYLNILLISSLCLSGLFYEFLGCIFCGITIAILMLIKVKKKDLVIYINMESITVMIIACMYIITAFYGIDWGMSLIGFVRMLTVVFFMICIMQCTIVERDRLIEIIPLVGCVMTLTGGVSIFIPSLRAIFFQAGRFGGFFLYANVYALFCVIGLIIICKKEVLSRKDIVKVTLLVVGIMMSGSRTAFLLLIFVSLSIAVKKRKMRLSIIIIIGLSFLFATLYVLYTGDIQNIGRFLTISIRSSTFLGRMLYAKDGMVQILKHPFGNGYLGYFFIEPVIQTGVYSVRYIHNDYMQMALDIGVIPMILFIFIIIKNIFSKKQENWRRLIIFAMAVHLLVDFDLEFISMWMILILLIDTNYGKNIHFRYSQICLLPAVAAIYIGMAMIPRYVGNVILSYKLIPFYTEAGIDVLENETDSENALRIADRLLKQNQYIHQAYDIQAILAYSDGRYYDMEQKKWKSVQLQKYNMDAYNRYVTLISRGISETKNTDERKYLLQRVMGVKNELEKIKKNTDTLAWEIRDVPEFELSKEVSDYIEEVEKFVD